jgi:hypothetical protein
MRYGELFADPRLAHARRHRVSRAGDAGALVETLARAQTDET